MDKVPIEVLGYDSMGEPVIGIREEPEGEYEIVDPQGLIAYQDRQVFMERQWGYKYAYQGCIERH